MEWSYYLQENLYTLLGKLIEAKKSYIQEGNLHPTKEELARKVGITIEKMDNLLFASRNPISMQQTLWVDQDTTFQVWPSSKFVFLLPWYYLSDLWFENREKEGSVLI